MILRAVRGKISAGGRQEYVNLWTTLGFFFDTSHSFSSRSLIRLFAVFQCRGVAFVR